ncbi:MAG: hypothetical protein AB1523_16465 [Bacillota bacterium]
MSETYRTPRWPARRFSVRGLSSNFSLGDNWAANLKIKLRNKIPESLIFLASREGFEPPTDGLEVRKISFCSFGEHAEMLDIAGLFLFAVGKRWEVLGIILK